MANDAKITIQLQSRESLLLKKIKNLETENAKLSLEAVRMKAQLEATEDLLKKAVEEKKEQLQSFVKITKNRHNLIDRIGG